MVEGDEEIEQPLVGSMEGRVDLRDCVFGKPKRSELVMDDGIRFIRRIFDEIIGLADRGLV